MEIKETKDALVGINELSILLITLLKDGISLNDFSVLFEKVVKDEAFKAKMEEAYNGIAQVPQELQDLSLSEIIELATLQVGYVPKIIDALKV